MTLSDSLLTELDILLFLSCQDGILLHGENPENQDDNFF